MGQVATRVISVFCFALMLFISPASSFAANAPVETQHEQANTPTTQQKGSSKAGIVGVVVGGAAGGVASVAAVSATGSVAGLSAAGMTSGLAAVGSVVGGGMLGGLAVSVALPVVGALGVGWAAYKIFHHPVNSAQSSIVDKSINVTNIFDMSSITVVVILLFALLAIVIFFRKYSKEMNRKLNDLTVLVVDRELDS